MIVTDIFSNLGNQLFIYAATKSIALDLGYDYRYRVIKPGFARQDNCVDNYGHEYSKDFEQAFHIDTSERIDELPEAVTKRWTWQRLPSTNFVKDVYKISDNTRLDGYFLCPKYFEHRREEVLRWFHFKDSYIRSCNKKRHELIEKIGANHLVSVHIRCGKDYRQQRQSIDFSYQLKAINKIMKTFPNDKLCFLVFSDVPDKAKKLTSRLKTDYHFVIASGTMYEDLCLMSLCDSHIIANSSFSWWGAWLARGSKGIVIRPSVWPTAYKGYSPADVFQSSWYIVEARREKLTLYNLKRKISYEYLLIALRLLKKGYRFAKKQLKYFIPLPLISVAKSFKRK